MDVTWWVDRWIEMGIGELHRYGCDDYATYMNQPIISMPRSDVEIADILSFMYIGNYRSFHYPESQALPMIELMQVGI